MLKHPLSVCMIHIHTRNKRQKTEEDSHRKEVTWHQKAARKFWEDISVDNILNYDTANTL